MRAGEATPGQGTIANTIRSLYERLRAVRGDSPAVQWTVAMPLARALFSIDLVDDGMAMMERLQASAPALRPNTAAWLEANLLLARGHRLHHRLDLAVENLSALAAHGQLHEHRGLAFEVHDELVRIKLGQARMREAARALAHARRFAADLQEPLPLGTCELHGAHIERADHRLPQAVSCISHALPLLRQAGCLASEAEAAWLLSKCQSLQGHAEEASRSRQQSLQLHRRHRQAVSRQQDAVRRLVFSNAVGPLDISEREIACLRWCAQGKTAWETGQIMALSEWTVVYHLERVKKKLGVCRKREAVAQAMVMGLIEPVREVPPRARTSRPVGSAGRGHRSSG
jgi:DNA-binding CsgD family transcriptional regulator